MASTFAIPTALKRMDFWTIRQVCDLYGITRSALYDAFKAGAPRKRVVHRALIPSKEFHDWVCKHRQTWVMPFFKEEAQEPA